jgi:HK97 family phage major capsid protein
VGEDSEAQLPSLADDGLFRPATGDTPEGAGGTLFGRPVFTLEQASAPGDVGDIVLLDPLSYLWTDRGLRSDFSLYVKFVEDECAFRFVLRCDGQPTWDRPIEPVNGTDDRSAFVTLAARA